MRRRFHYVGGRNREVFAQYRQQRGPTGLLEIGETSLEEAFVREYRERCSPTALVRSSDADRVEISREQPLTGRRFLDFRDDRRRAGFQRSPKIASRRNANFRLALPLVQGWNGAGKIFAFPGDNTGQDVWNGFEQG